MKLELKNLSTIFVTGILTFTLVSCSSKKNQTEKKNPEKISFNVACPENLNGEFKNYFILMEKIKKIYGAKKDLKISGKISEKLSNTLIEISDYNKELIGDYQDYLNAENEKIQKEIDKNKDNKDYKAPQKLEFNIDEVKCNLGNDFITNQKLKDLYTSTLKLSYPNTKISDKEEEVHFMMNDFSPSVYKVIYFDDSIIAKARAEIKDDLRTFDENEIENYKKAKKEKLLKEKEDKEKEGKKKEDKK